MDLGSGGGEFARRLGEVGIEPLRLDRQLTGLGPGEWGVRADVLQLPFGASRLGLFTAANLVRHVPETDLPALLAETARCAACGARQIVVEDLPEARDAAEANYRRILDLLARTDRTRGTSCESDRVERHLEGSGWRSLGGSRFDNELQPREPTLPLDWIRSRATSSALLDEVSRLEQDVREQGLAYGQAWYLVLEREES